MDIEYKAYLEALETNSNFYELRCRRLRKALFGAVFVAGIEGLAIYAIGIKALMCCGGF